MSVLTGFMLGLVAALGALIAGWGALAALGLYSGIGVLGTLTGAAISLLPVGAGRDGPVQHLG